MEQDTQIGQVRNNMYESVPEEGEQIIQEKETPGLEESEQEFLEVEDEKIPVKEIDNLKSYKHFQRKYDLEKQETQKERETRIRLETEKMMLEEQLNSFQRPKEETQAPKRPIFPPKPHNFSLADIYDENTPSGQWQLQVMEYNADKAKYDEYWQTQRERQEEQDKRAKQAEQEFIKLKNNKITEFQKFPGTTLQEAMEAFDYTNSPESLKPENIIPWLRFLKTQKLRPKQQGQRPGEIQSASTVPGENEPKPDESKTFIDSFGAKGANIFATK